MKELYHVSIVWAVLIFGKNSGPDFWKTVPIWYFYSIWLDWGVNRIFYIILAKFFYAPYLNSKFLYLIKFYYCFRLGTHLFFTNGGNSIFSTLNSLFYLLHISYWRYVHKTSCSVTPLKLTDHFTSTFPTILWPLTGPKILL